MGRKKMDSEQEGVRGSVRASRNGLKRTPEQEKAGRNRAERTEKKLGSQFDFGKPKRGSSGRTKKTRIYRRRHNSRRGGNLGDHLIKGSRSWSSGRT